MNKITKKISTIIEQLSEEEAQEVLELAEYLSFKKKIEKQNKKLDFENDPILNLIGLADCEPFAEDIDEQLYGD